MVEDGEGTEGTDGPAGLRKHAKQLEKELAEIRAAQERDAAELQAFRRERAFATAVAEAKAEGVTLADVGDLPPDQITPTLIRTKAAEKAEAARAAEERQAKELGFDTVDEYRAVLQAAKEAKAKQASAQQTAADVATSSAGGPPPRKTPQEAGIEAWKAARQKGRPADVAGGEFVSAVARAFMEQQEGSAPAGGRT